MAKLQVPLLVLIALGTISRCQDANAQRPDSAAVIASGSAPLGCGVPKPINVRFNAFKVKGPDSDVVYQRVTVSSFDLEFAQDIISSSLLPANNLAECAKAVATTGFEAFGFYGLCYALRLNAHFLKCQTGEIAFYVRTDYINEEPAVAPLDEAPFKELRSGRTEYRLSRVVDADDDHPCFTRVKVDDEFPSTYLYSIDDFVYFENGDFVVVYSTFMDLNFCLNDGAYGLQFRVNSQFGPYPTTLYFFEECGKTIKIGADPFEDRRVVYSHPGFGCQDYPTGLPDECIVTFEGEDSVLLQHTYGFFFPETDSDDGGLIMTIPVKEIGSDVAEIRNVFQNNAYNSGLNPQKSIEVSFLRQPSKRALGFVLSINPEAP